jgi:hypothetical protein
MEEESYFLKDPMEGEMQGDPQVVEGGTPSSNHIWNQRGGHGDKKF